MNSHQRRVLKRKTYRGIVKRIEEDTFNNIFTSHQIIQESGYVDFLFLGEHKGKKVFWNAYITTGKSDYYSEIESLALDEAHEKYPWPEKYDPFYSVPSTEHKGCTEMTNDPSFPDEPARGELRRKHMATRTMEMIDSLEHPLSMWNVEIDESYEWGVGLHIRVDKDYLDIGDVYEFINEYNGLGLGVFKNKELNALKGRSIEPIALTTEQLGVKLSDNGMWVEWKDSRSRDTVAIDMEKI